ncbi:hypothetical protein IJI94_02620 [Candidatus Saccharibacteria bacterium]|nr:hypothetical protein [Candidatus Saccharibacteria bacterium]
MQSSTLTLLISVLVVGVLIFIAILLTSKRSHSFDTMEYQTSFLEIENNLIKDSKASYNMSVVNADKLLDKALCEMGVPGKTMGERMKKLGNTKFSQTNAVWHAHKLRNQIAHEHNFQLDYNQAKHALSVYKQALKDLGAI